MAKARITTVTYRLQPCFEARRRLLKVRVSHRLHHERFTPNMVNDNGAIASGGDSWPAVLPKSSCLLSLRPDVVKRSPLSAEPALSFAPSEVARGDLVARATGRTFVGLFAMTVARSGALHVGGYNE